MITTEKFERAVRDFCWIHCRVEPVTGRRHRWCQTCGHLYRSRAELWWVTLQRFGILARPSNMPVCPYCKHPWTT